MQRSPHLRLAVIIALCCLMPGCNSDSTMDPIAPSPAFAVTITPIALPFYARVEDPFLVHSDTWAAIVFYRPPECVPADFNLLQFFDIPGAFFCGPLTVEGFEMRKEPGQGAPWQQVITGLGAVPVWIVDWSELQVALQDDVLTRAEIEGLSSTLTGTATQFHEMLQPSPTRTPSRLVISATGVLEDGRAFRLHFTELGSTAQQITIDVR